MRSAADKLAEAIETWRREDARERVARWRGDPDALSEADVHARHSRLRSAQGRELLEEAIDRGQLGPEDQAAVEAAFAEARVGPRLGEERAVEAELWAARVPWDSDHYAASQLFGKMQTDPSEKRRRSIGRALEATFHELGARRRELAVELGAPVGATELADRALSETDDAWQEATARICHAAHVSPESWTELDYALRATDWDDAAKPSERWRRLADGLEVLGMHEALARSVKVERRRAPPQERAAQIAVVEPRRDVRVGPGFERGIASERQAAEVLGHALCAALVHPGLPWHRARPTAQSMGTGLGALFAHLLADPEHLGRARSLSSAERRRLGELHVALELAALRTAATRVALGAHLEEGELGERAVSAFRRAWGVDDCPEGLAVTLAAGPDASAELAARESAPRLYVALRERFDVDFWRNPAVEEPVRAGASRALDLEAWLAELDVPEIDLAERYGELL